MQIVVGFAVFYVYLSPSREYMSFLTKIAINKYHLGKVLKREEGRYFSETLSPCGICIYYN